MTYNVFSGTLNPTLYLSIDLGDFFADLQLVSKK